MFICHGTSFSTAQITMGEGRKHQMLGEGVCHFFGSTKKMELVHVLNGWESPGYKVVFVGL